MSLQNFLRSFPLFAPLSESDYDLLLTDIQETPYQKGEYIFREGDPTEWFHIVKEGTVKCVKSSPDGRDMTLKILTPGDLFCCEASVFEGSVHPGCAKVLDGATILKIHKKRYLEILSIFRVAKGAVGFLSVTGKGNPEIFQSSQRP
ncbi:MAG: cyclic nucleotide-binding domain-containing protein [Nitrospirales bacterium]